MVPAIGRTSSLQGKQHNMSNNGDNEIVHGQSNMSYMCVESFQCNQDISGNQLLFMNPTCYYDLFILMCIIQVFTIKQTYQFATCC